MLRFSRDQRRGMGRGGNRCQETVGEDKKDGLTIWRLGYRGRKVKREHSEPIVATVGQRYTRLAGVNPITAQDER